MLQIPRYQQLKTYSKKTIHRFNHLTVRERALCWSAGFVLITSLWFVSLWDPITQKKQQLTYSIQESRSNLEQLRQQIANLLPANSRQAYALPTVERLSQEGSQLDVLLANTAQHVSSLAEFIKLQHSILNKQQDLNLIEFKTEKPIKLIGAGQLNENELFQNNLIIKVNTTYFGLLNYLRDLESSHWQITWDKLRYESTRYPLGTAVIGLHIYTVNTIDEGPLLAANKVGTRYE